MYTKTINRKTYSLAYITYKILPEIKKNLTLHFIKKVFVGLESV